MKTQIKTKGRKTRVKGNSKHKLPSKERIKLLCNREEDEDRCYQFIAKQLALHWNDEVEQFLLNIGIQQDMIACIHAWGTEEVIKRGRFWERHYKELDEKKQDGVQYHSNN